MLNHVNKNERCPASHVKSLVHGMGTKSGVGNTLSKPKMATGAPTEEPNTSAFCATVL